jgi:hypothetical protein
VLQLALAGRRSVRAISQVEREQLAEHCLPTGHARGILRGGSVYAVYTAEEGCVRTRHLTVKAARRQLSRPLNGVFCGRQGATSESSGLPKAAIISMADFERLLELEEAATEGQASGGQG